MAPGKGFGDSDRWTKTALYYLLSNTLKTMDTKKKKYADSRPPLTLRFSPEERARLNAAAKAAGISRHALMRDAILRCLSNSAVA